MSRDSRAPTTMWSSSLPLRTSKSACIHRTVSGWETNHKGNSTILTVEDWHCVMESELNIVLLTVSGKLVMSFGTWHAPPPPPLQGYYLPWYALEITVTDQISLCCKGSVSVSNLLNIVCSPLLLPWIHLTPHVNAAVLYSRSFFLSLSLCVSGSILQAVPLWSCFSAVWNLRLKSICSPPPPPPLCIKTSTDINTRKQQTKKGVVPFNKSKQS